MPSPSHDPDDRELAEEALPWAEPDAPARWRSVLTVVMATVVLAATVIAGTVYGGLRPNLRTEYWNIARALAQGEGFAHPFDQRTGPSAWMAPVLPVLLALVVADDGSVALVNNTIVILHAAVLIATAVLVLVLARQTGAQLGVWTAAALFLGALLYQHRLCFESASLDCWLLLVTVDLLIAGLCWARPLRGSWAAAGWGVFGGLCVLVSPVIGAAWWALTLAISLRPRALTRLAVALVAAGLTITPWVVRNYLVFGRLIPVKSNLAYELYQSQCLQADGVLHSRSFDVHPFGTHRPEGRAYREMGEMAYLDKKSEEFREAVAAAPLDFLDRVADRFLAATLWFVPFQREQESQRPWAVWLCRLAHPLPLVALALLIGSHIAGPRLAGAQWLVIGAYLLCLLPYVAISYYDRYAFPLLGMKALLVFWAADRIVSWRWRA
jgi:hypothetical protein